MHLKPERSEGFVSLLRRAAAGNQIREERENREIVRSIRCDSHPQKPSKSRAQGAVRSRRNQFRKLQTWRKEHQQWRGHRRLALRGQRQTDESQRQRRYGRQDEAKKDTCIHKHSF